MFHLPLEPLFTCSYRESAARLSKFIKLLPRSPLQETADWIEYTQAVGGLQHLRMRGLDLPFYKLYLLDILLVFLLIALFILLSLKYFLTKCVVGIVMRTSGTEREKTRPYKMD